ncbi:MazG nucleotide pyrophosphohydrolase domain-containing protein, partial [Bartonella apis]|uniref:MazG nucleotide pyrophosphohydrolase domain-containing protein n=1 Tax=Bartonella apis TaxID=1686310 RepID=UPI00242D9F1E
RRQRQMCIRDRLKEALETVNEENIRDEFGDVYFTVLNLARRLGIAPEQALKQANNKFRYRFNFIEEALAKQNKKLEDANLDEMEDLWNEAKLEQCQKQDKQGEK